MMFSDTYKKWTRYLKSNKLYGKWIKDITEYNSDIPYQDKVSQISTLNGYICGPILNVFMSNSISALESSIHLMASWNWWRNDTKIWFWVVTFKWFKVLEEEKIYM